MTNMIIRQIRPNPVPAPPGQIVPEAILRHFLAPDLEGGLDLSMMRPIRSGALSDRPAVAPPLTPPSIKTPPLAMPPLTPPHEGVCPSNEQTKATKNEHIQSDMAVDNRRKRLRCRHYKRVDLKSLNNNSSFEATLRNKSDGGARLEMSQTEFLPSRFTLTYKDGDGMESCLIVWRQSDAVGVAFV